VTIHGSISENNELTLQNISSGMTVKFSNEPGAYR